MKKSYLSRKDSIVLTAIDIIDKLGFQELSIRELANRQGVSEPALYRHYKSKQDIVLAVLDYYARFDSMLAGTINDRKMEAKEAIKFLMTSYMEYYENYPAITALVFAYDTLRYDEVLLARVKEIVDSRFDLVVALIEKGYEKQELKQVFESGVLAHLVLGLSRSLIMKWRMENRSFSLKQEYMGALNDLLNIC